MALWHRDIRLPDNFKAPTQRVRLDYSNHALGQLETDKRFGDMPKFNTIPLAAFEVIEVETKGNKVVKYVMRGHYDSKRDMTFVMIPDTQGKTMFVKTCWFNLRHDDHHNLDRKKYVS